MNDKRNTAQREPLAIVDLVTKGNAYPWPVRQHHACCPWCMATLARAKRSDNEGNAYPWPER